MPEIVSEPESSWDFDQLDQGSEYEAPEEETQEENFDKMEEKMNDLQNEV